MTTRSRVLEFDVVVPTIGRPTLATLLRALAASAAAGARPGHVFVVDDRPDRDRDRDGARELLAAADFAPLSVQLLTTCCGRRGPAAARNVGWQRSAAEWIAFLDDDVVPNPDWCAQLTADVERFAADSAVAAVSGRVVVPLPHDARPTDFERDVAGLEHATYITADIAYRRDALVRSGGFDECFPLAYREDADLALRVLDLGWSIERGTRVVSHPVGAARFGASIRRQRGNASDARMRRKHGPRWRARARAGRGRLPVHGVTVGMAVLAVAAAPRAPRVAGLAAAVWLAATAQFAWTRLRPGPRTIREVATVVGTSVVIPFAAVHHRLRGEWQERRCATAVLFDRDGTLVHDVPYNGDPARVQPVATAAGALARLRAHGLRLAVVSNQSGVARGLISTDDVDAVNRRIDQLVGPIGEWWCCPHADDARCACRKPRPGLLVAAMRASAAAPSRTVMIGDTGADMDAARRAGCRGILVPNERTRHEEVVAAPQVAHDLAQAVDLVLGAAR